MWLWYVLWIWPIWLLYDVIDRKRGDSVTLLNVERSISRLPPPTECPSVRAAIYRINYGLQTVVLLVFSEVTCRKAMRLKPLARSQWLIVIWQKIMASELKHDFQIIITQCSVAFCSTLAKTNQGICQVDYKYIPVSIRRKWVNQYSRKILNKLHFKEVCVRI